jgi:hypothetical protein
MWVEVMKDDQTPNPTATPSILECIPDCLKKELQDGVSMGKIRKAILISSDNLAYKFIHERWGIMALQRMRYHNLFSSVRNACYSTFQHCLAQGRIEWTVDNKEYVFGVYKFEEWETQGKLILGFVPM